MQVEAHRNLTVHLIRRNAYSTLRLRGCCPRRIPAACPSTRSLAAERARCCAPTEKAGDECRLSDILRPLPFPHDTPLPIRLPELPPQTEMELDRKRAAPPAENLLRRDDLLGRLLDVTA